MPASDHHREEQRPLDPHAHAKCLRCPNIGSNAPCPFSQERGVTERWELYECERGKEKWKVSRP